MEIGTVLFLLLASIIGFKLFLNLKDFKFKWLRWVVLLISLASFFFMGEEASWGQHYFNWKTPDAFARHHILDNKQHESNLHNSRNKTIVFLVKDIPRFGLQSMILILGIFIPSFISFRRINLDPDSIYYWVCGTYVCIPTSIFAFFIDYPERMFFYKEYRTIKDMGLETPEFFKTHTLESKECMWGLFLFLFIFSFYYRYKQYSQNKKSNNTEVKKEKVLAGNS